MAPFIGRLFWNEYLALFTSLVLISIEGLLHVITFCLPQPIIQFLYRQSKRLFKVLSSPQGRLIRARRATTSGTIARASDFLELCALWGYEAEEHIVQTGDGYLLGLHRLPRKRGEPFFKVNAGEGTPYKPVVYLHHGLLMNSEVWVCLTNEERCLPFRLVEQGYDVWLGNNRGNKYSKKCISQAPASTAFWNFSMDQFAFHDIPDSIEYILSVTSQKSLSYIGFSQGTAQAFATLSIHPTLNQKINLFIALAPAMSPAGLSNGVVDALMKASPDVLFLAFGRRSILSSTPMWQTILYPPIFVRIIDLSLLFLFNWTGININSEQKLAAYPHLYSFTSTKSVVHWFQIIRNKSFQMYDDDAGTFININNKNRYYKPAKFPTKNIKTPIVLVYGCQDSLVDIDVMLDELPSHTVATPIRHYEHLDFLWAKDVADQVFPHIFDALESYGLVHTRWSAGDPNYLVKEDASDLHQKENDVPLSPQQPQFPPKQAQTVASEQLSNSPNLPSYSDDERAMLINGV
ncbi:lysosomal acid lipase/cholesteryl ester hydrolase [Paracoccidioides lutzii Pb01]|uniref:Lysosomal acid lipase/cholesteryl ester hydrolase n=1 Tax=Paracoccidioides lutzii (strain ATCC MYA-826 / Pb01) TaxID=502779 RepID=C1H018_PARBA|nr:lysosomal acid lipase/cholesteryl ester hydrolase [Paracoccidioides lutzii Pb01]EEH33059.1 lysosomal acid lipase/cholesteryl ester hydrolase [Paracoccidioides lutzii Pb01]